MKPIDLRNANWNDLRARIEGDRGMVLDAWREHGPGTTREVALKSGVDLLSLRPRTTELVELGFVVMVEDDDVNERADESLKKARRCREGRYRALTDGEAWDLFNRRKQAATDPQLSLI